MVDILELQKPENYSVEEIKKAWLVFCKQYHPDVCTDPNATEIFSEYSQRFKHVLQNHHEIKKDKEKYNQVYSSIFGYEAGNQEEPDEETTEDVTGNGELGLSLDELIDHFEKKGVSYKISHNFPKMCYNSFSRHHGAVYVIQIQGLSIPTRLCLYGETSTIKVKVGHLELYQIFLDATGETIAEYREWKPLLRIADKISNVVDYGSCNSAVYYDQMKDKTHPFVKCLVDLVKKEQIPLFLIHEFSGKEVDQGASLTEIKKKTSECIQRLLMKRFDVYDLVPSTDQIRANGVIVKGHVLLETFRNKSLFHFYDFRGEKQFLRCFLTVSVFNNPYHSPCLYEVQAIITTVNKHYKPDRRTEIYEFSYAIDKPTHDKLLKHIIDLKHEKKKEEEKIQAEKEAQERKELEKKNRTINSFKKALGI